MYFFDWMCWKTKLEPQAPRQDASKVEPLYEDDDKLEQTAAKRCVCETPKARGPVYVYNDTVFEMRCGIWESKRGLVTILSLAVIYVLTQFSRLIGILALNLAENISTDSPTPDGGDVYLLLFFSTLVSLISWFYLKYGFRFTRLEMLTSRHLLIRFNRKTQQVHLHRPPHCGGIVTLPWDGITSSGTELNAPAVSPLEIPLMLSWSSQVTGTLHPELACVGKPTLLQSEIRDEWEFIRRFMDEGPNGLPRPSITSHFPWPWQAFTPQFEGLEKYFRGSSIKIKIGLLLISPAFLIFGLGHWLSLMLCWKPRWPKVIRQAGMPGKPVPPLTTLADYPVHIQQRLREDAHLWHVHPGSRPEKPPRKKRARRVNTHPSP